MTAWELVKGLNIDLSNMTAEKMQTILANLNSSDINGIIADLKEERKKNQKLAKYLDLAISIAEIVLTKGIALA